MIRAGAYLRHRHDNLNVERYGGRGHDDDQGLPGQQREQHPSHCLPHDCVHDADLAIWRSEILFDKSGKSVTCIMKVENSKRDRRKNASEVQEYGCGDSLVKCLLPYKAVVEIREVERYSLFEVLEQSLHVSWCQRRYPLKSIKSTEDGAQTWPN